MQTRHIKNFIMSWMVTIIKMAKPGNIELVCNPSIGEIMCSPCPNVLPTILNRNGLLLGLKIKTELDTVAHTCNPILQETEKYWVQGQSGLCNEANLNTKY